MLPTGPGIQRHQAPPAAQPAHQAFAPGVEDRLGRVVDAQLARAMQAAQDQVARLPAGTPSTIAIEVEVTLGADGKLTVEETIDVRPGPVPVRPEPVAQVQGLPLPAPAPVAGPVQGLPPAMAQGPAPGAAKPVDGLPAGLARLLGGLPPGLAKLLGDLLGGRRAQPGLPVAPPAADRPAQPALPVVQPVQPMNPVAQPAWPFPFGGFAPAAAAAPVLDEAAEVKRLLTLVNAERAKAGAGPLTLEPRLNEVAKAHSVDMAKRDYFSHNTPEGKRFFERAGAAGVFAGGENIARGARSGEDAFAQWLGSPKHRQNMLNPAFTTMGAGIADGRWTQMFG